MVDLYFRHGRIEMVEITQLVVVMVLIAAGLGLTAITWASLQPRQAAVVAGAENPYQTPATVETEIETDTDPDRYIMDLAAYAWALPADYFRTWSRDAFVIYAPRGVDEVGASQSPLHSIMSASHPSTPTEQQERLWANPAFRRAVAHVFHNCQPAEVKAWAEARLSDGYWAPMGKGALRACREGLVGLEMYLGPECTRQYRVREEAA
jgi:hypothetical protein